MRPFGIFGAFGLLLTILILKFLMSGPFQAFENLLTTAFTKADVTLQNLPASVAFPQIPTVPGM